MRKARRSALVVGLGRFGGAAASRLCELGWDVVGVDKSAEVVDYMKDHVAHVVQLDAGDEESLGTVGVSDFDVCVVSRGESIESSILLVLNLQHLEAKRIVAKAVSQHHARILRRLGVDAIIFPEIDAGNRLAEHLLAPNREWSRELSNGRELAIIHVPKGRTGCPLDLWQATHRPTIEILMHLSPDGKPLTYDKHAALKEGEILIVSGAPEDILALGQ